MVRQLNKQRVGGRTQFEDDEVCVGFEVFYVAKLSFIQNKRCISCFSLTLK